MEKAMELLEKLADKLGVAVQYLWGTLVKQAFVNGISQLITSVICIFILIFVVKYTPKLYNRFSERVKFLSEDRVKNGTGFNGSHDLSSFEEDNAKSLAGSVHIISTILSILLVIAIIVLLNLGIKHIYNPDYYAMQDILRYIK